MNGASIYSYIRYARARTHTHTLYIYMCIYIYIYIVGVCNYVVGVDNHGSRKLTFPDYVTMAQDGGKVVSLTHRPLLRPRNTPGTHFYKRLSRPQGHSAFGRFVPMKNSNDTIWNRTSDLPIF